MITEDELSLTDDLSPTPVSTLCSPILPFFQKTTRVTFFYLKIVDDVNSADMPTMHGFSGFLGAVEHAHSKSNRGKSGAAFTRKNLSLTDSHARTN